MEFPDRKLVRIGRNVSIECDEFEVGDGVKIGDNVHIEGPRVSLGDYTLIREDTQILGKASISIGMCCWIGQGTILDGTETLQIGNGVGIGAHSQLWTHIRFGDTLQGCRWESETPMVVEDDVWFVGHCLVSPIHAKARSMAMLGSVVTRNMEENRIYAGVPAKDITDKLGPQYREVTVDERFARLKTELEKYLAAHPGRDGAIEVVKEWPAAMDPAVSYFNVATREYTKRLTEAEMGFMLHLLVPIKFYPAAHL
jgi:acetyltransferase-like isoleucine patch superfamily enzyme